MKRLRNPLTLFVTIVIVLFLAFLSVTVCAADNTPMTVAVTQNADNIKIGLLVFQTIVVVALVITVMFIPSIGTDVSTITILKSLNLFDTYISIFILSFSFMGTNYLLFYATLNGMPKDFIEAAKTSNR
jgi:ABC-type Fe3+ transport system permease subunit